MTFETNGTTIGFHITPLGFCEAIYKFYWYYEAPRHRSTWQICVQNIVGAGVIELEHARSVATTQCWRDFTQNVQ